MTGWRDRKADLSMPFFRDRHVPFFQTSVFLRLPNLSIYQKSEKQILRIFLKFKKLE